MQKVYTLQEVAKIFRVHEITVRRWIKSGKVKVKTVGRKYLFEESEVERLLK